MRIRAQEAEGDTDEVECHDKVQRVVDGKSHRFDNLQALADTLLAMLSSAKGTERRGNRKEE